ncbi:MAG: long-chain fatty acid--CoA ligase [Actinobacteria bacterium]|nr:long-chain fatty acid--CoA ligase [Actinomycetota bacterium]
MTRTHSKGRTPLEVPTEHSLTTRLWQYAERSGGQQALRYWADGAWHPLTWHELADRVRGVAAGLIALGVDAGDRVVVMGPTSAQWTIADLAVLAAGGVTVPVYETSGVDQCAWILSDSGAKVAICSDADTAATLDAARHDDGALSDVFVMAEGGLDAIAARGDDNRDAVDERVAQTSCDSMASIIYTSGTTGRPKGCVLTHGNILVTARQAQLALANVLLADGASTLLFIPLAHIFARVIQFALLDAGTVLGYARSIQTLSEDLQSFKPTFLLAVPRIFEKVFNAAQAKAQGAKATVFAAAVDTATEWSEADTPGLVTNVKRAVFDRLVYAKLRAALGGKVAHCISGGAPLAPHLAHFFRAVGVDILEGYGLTETTAASAVNPPEWNKIGTVGQPWPGTEFRVAEDGELLIRGPGVFQGYWQNSDATDEVLDGDGWFHTGDLGAIDDDGFVSITGRKKEIIVTAGGKNVAPAVLEERLKAHRLISQAMVVGDKRPFVGALITLDPEELQLFAAEHGLGDAVGAAQSDRVRAEVDRAVAEANTAVSRAESIRKTAILERDFTIEEGELTPTLKVRRMVVADHFSTAIDDLYDT